MKLKDVEIRPGYVKQVLDNKGTIKAVVEGLFQEDDLSLLPPIKLLFVCGKGSYSYPNINDPIWVFFERSNPQNLYWMRRPDLDTTTADVCGKGDRNTEVLMSRSQGLDFAQIYFNNEDGMMLKKDSSSININKEGNVVLSNGEDNRNIEINTDGISLGSVGGSKQKAVLGDNLLTALLDINTILQAVNTACKANPYTMGISTVIEGLLPRYQQDIQKILSDNVTLD